MKVVIDESLIFRVEETDNLKSLSLNIYRPRSDCRTVVNAVAGYGGEMSGDYAWLSREWLRIRGDRGWRAEFDKMISFAKSKGWVDEESDRVRAHINWAS
jgi:hypothetical protein